MKVLFVPAYVDGLPYHSASIRFRAQWPAKYWDNADVYPNCSVPFGEYDAYIFQKAYLTKQARRWLRALRVKGKLLVFDLCDADWLQSDTHEHRLLDALELCDFAVCPTVALEEQLARWLPAYVIVDRLDLDEFERLDNAGFNALLRRRRETSAQDRCIWFGYAHNLGELDHIWPDLWPVLDQYDMPLTILSNELPDEWQERAWGQGRQVAFVEWTREGANAVIQAHDFALVPQRSPYKSDNREATAWLLGVEPVQGAEGILRRLEDSKGKLIRFHGLWYMYERAFADYDVRVSSEVWQSLVAQYLDARDGTHFAADALDRRFGPILPIPHIQAMDAVVSMPDQSSSRSVTSE